MMRMLTSTVAIAQIGLAQFLLTALLPCIAQAQDRLAIRVNVGLVNVAFTARDSSGKLVADLTKDDVEVLDDGVPQGISFFARSSDLPLALGLISDVSGSQEPFLKRHHHDLDIFLKDVLTERDRAFLVCFGNRVRLVNDYTAKREPLMDSLKDFDGKRRADRILSWDRRSGGCWARHSTMRCGSRRSTSPRGRTPSAESR